MRTHDNNNLSSALFGKTRRSILALLYTNVDEQFYVRQIARAVGVSVGTLHRELKLLADSGIIESRVRGMQVYYQANRKCPVFQELKGLVIKTAGVADVLKSALSPLAASVRVAFVYGSFAAGEEGGRSDVDIMVIGKCSFGEVSKALGSAEESLAREVNPTVYPPDDFRKKIARGHHFLNTVLKEEKIFLIGDENELGRLAQKRPVKETRRRPKTNR